MSVPELPLATPPAGDNAVDGVEVPPLLNATDYTKFSGLDVDWFINAAGATIRNFLNWHVSPSITQTCYRDVSGDGTIMLPSRYVTDVASVTPPWDGAAAIDPDAYTWDQRGWISFKTGITYGFAPSPASASLWPIDTARLFDAYRRQSRRMIIEFTHGYDVLPYPIAEVGYELVMRVLEKPAGVASEVQAGPYRYRFGEFGIVLSADQKNRIASYRMPGLN